MNLMLTDFMQTVSLKDPTNAKSFLVFTNEDGEELRVPVGQEAIEAITRFAFGRKQFPEPAPSAPAPEASSEEPYEEDTADATTFGGDVEEGEDPDLDEDPVRPFELSRPGPPKSEAEIQSL